MNNTHNWNGDYREQAWRKTRTLMWILHRTSVYANASMNDAKCSNLDSDNAVTSGWSANESLEFDPRPIDTDEQSSNSSLKAANTEAPCRSAYSSRHSYQFLRSMSVRNPRSIVWLTAETPPRIRVTSVCLWRESAFYIQINRRWVWIAVFQNLCVPISSRAADRGFGHLTLSCRVTFGLIWEV